MQEMTTARAARSTAIADRLLSVWFATWAIFFAATTLCTILNFGLPQPTFDQLKNYGKYLSEPFLHGVLVAENNHHPIVLTLLADAEIRWFHANQYLQLAVGTACAFVAAALIGLTVWRERELPRHMRAAAVLLGVVCVLWLGNARMLVQSMGVIQVYVVVLCVVLSALCMWRAVRTDSWRWCGAVALCCATAMFTFGAGAAAFPTMLALAFMQRLNWRKLAALMLAAIACAFVYIVLLPGHESVQEALHVRPLDGLVVAARWLSSPLANAFFGLAQPPVQPWLADNLNDPVGRALVLGANGLQEASGVPWVALSTAFGFAGVAIAVARGAARYWRGGAFTRLEGLAYGICLFGLMTALVISVGRLTYFAEHPEQIFAERYLEWPSLFWTGLLLVLLVDACRVWPRAARYAAVLAVAVMPVALLPTHRQWAGWSASVYRLTQQAAAAARSDVRDAVMFPNDADAGRDDVLRTLSLLKQQRLAMFADAGWQEVGKQWPTASADPRFETAAAIGSTYQDSDNGFMVARFDGVVTRGIGPLTALGDLAVLDADGRVAGLAEYSFIDGSSLRLNIPAKRGFDGYIRDYHDGQPYRLVLLRNDSRQAVPLQELRIR
jgi:hypothetical protein